MSKVLISQSAQKSVYRDGDKAIKVFCKDFPKAEVLYEAINTARVEELEGLNVAKVLEVSMVDGCWAITKEFIEGKTLAQLMEEDPDNVEKYLEQMVDLHLEVHSKTCPLLYKLKDKMLRQIQELDNISEINRYDLLTKLDSMPKHVKLCHGDFCPENIIVSKDKLYIIDWVHATQGNASADAARTYLLLCLKDRKMADMYMDMFCRKTGTAKKYVQNWLPLVAAAQMSKKRPEEKELLTSWLNVVDYQ